MSEDSREIACVGCGKLFVVQHASALPILPNKCPDCEKSGALTEAEAVAKLEQIRLQYDHDAEDPMYWYAFRVGIIIMVLAVIGLIILFGYVMAAKDAEVPLFKVMGLATLIFVGGFMSYWGRDNQKK
jgi:phage FluMu protein Com